MTEDKGRIEGHCLCGAVTVRAVPKRRHVEACHCHMCRRWGGVAYLGVQCGRDVEFAGEEHIVRYRSSEWAERGFCGRCGSSLFFHYLPKGTYGCRRGRQTAAIRGGARQAHGLRAYFRGCSCHPIRRRCGSPSRWGR